MAQIPPLVTTFVVPAKGLPMAQTSHSLIQSKAERDTFTLYDLAERWGVSYSTIYEQARRNALPVPVIRVGRRYLVSRKAYNDVMEARHK